MGKTVVEINYTFSEMLSELKNVKTCCAARSGWTDRNGKGAFIYLVPEGIYQACSPAIKGQFENDMVPYGAYIAMKTAQGNVVPWTPSQADTLAEDWEILV